MSSPSHVEPATVFEPDSTHPATVSATRPFLWSLRREMWEYRSLYMAPLIVAGLVLLGDLIGLASLPRRVRAAEALPAVKQLATIGAPYASAAASILLTGLIVAAFYCLGALNNERRDRSILFWKSLPVSDLTAVLAKAAVPFLILPAILFVVAALTQLVMLLLGSAALAANGMDAGTLWSHWPMIRMSLVLAYILVIVTLWYAPIYAWLLMISGLARRMPLLWAVLPVLGLVIVERIAFDTKYLLGLVGYRVAGFVHEGFAMPVNGNPTSNLLSLLTPERFFSAPGLWLGLVAAVAFLAASVWLRRYREPG